MPREKGELGWIDPATGQPSSTLEHERVRADRERETRIEDREALADAEAEHNPERKARPATEARVL